MPVIPRTRSNSLGRKLVTASTLCYANFGRCLQPDRVELRILRWNFYILFSAKTGDSRDNQSALKNSVTRPIRSSQSRDCCDRPWTVQLNISCGNLETGQQSTNRESVQLSVLTVGKKASYTSSIY